VVDDPPAGALAGVDEKRSASIQISSSSGVSGNANGVNHGPHSSALRKQRRGVLRLIPRGSKPTRSNRARTSSGKSPDANRTKSTPEPPGPPGFTNSEPIRRFSSAAGRRIRKRPTNPAAGRS
jgi:hypothetical protein